MNQAERFEKICSALCNEDQPHPWVGKARELKHELLTIFGCQEAAQWVLYGDGPDDETFACTEHLSALATVEFREVLRVTPVEGEDNRCCFIV